jgi:hypothetical protein
MPNLRYHVECTITTLLQLCVHDPFINETRPLKHLIIWWTLELKILRKIIHWLEIVLCNGLWYMYDIKHRIDDKIDDRADSKEGHKLLKTCLWLKLRHKITANWIGQDIFHPTVRNTIYHLFSSISALSMILRADQSNTPLQNDILGRTRPWSWLSLVLNQTCEPLFSGP